MTATASGRYVLQVGMGKSLRDKLRYAQQLAAHQNPSGDVAQILERALDVLIERLEKRKFAPTTRPRVSARPSHAARTIPAHVRRAVWRRDGGRCTFVSEDGRRCGARSPLEFDHVVPVARGGRATIDGVRLRCRTHNQLEAERVFGAVFMAERRAFHDARDEVA